MPEQQPSSGKKPEIAQLDQILVPPDAENFTEATIKYEAPSTRQTREAREIASAAHERLLTLLRLSSSIVFMFIFVCIGVYVLLLKSDTTEAQRIYVSNVLTAIASGSAGYAFAKKQDKPDKE